MENQEQSTNKLVYTAGEFNQVAQFLLDKYGIKQDEIEKQDDGGINAHYCDKNGKDKEIHFTPKAIHKKAEEIKIAQAHAAHHAHVEEKHVLDPEIIEIVLIKYRRENPSNDVKGFQNKKGGLNIHVYLQDGQKIIHLSHNDVTRIVENSIADRPLPSQNKIKHLLEK